ncbi:PspC domain-containing protein [Dermatophilaceae bacterium Soc4.6]
MSQTEHLPGVPPTPGPVHAPGAMGAPGAPAAPLPGLAPAPPPPARLYRSTSDRWLAGVCGGVGAHLGIEPGLVRLVMVVAVIAGPGLPVYAFLWVMTRPDTRAPGGPAAAVRTDRRPLGYGQVLVVVGVLLGLVGLSWGGPLAAAASHLSLVVPVVAVAAGAFLAWSQLDDTERVGWRRRSRRGKVLAVVLPAVGVSLVLVGVVALFTQGQGLAAATTSAVAALAVLLGAVVVAAPWVLRLARGLQREQSERIRATERADIAAHLHDSVLQTLALIQRRSDDPATVVRLARSQERELRTWLYADRVQSGDTIAAAVAAVAHEVEDDHGVPIDLVVTGDQPLDEGGSALVKAAREAMLNAVRHGAPPVSAYVEVGPHGVECFVRDHGEGFDLDEVGPDRLGVRQSILGRMERHGGSARIRHLEGGTEIELTLPPHPQTSGDHAGRPEPEGTP